MRENDPQRDAMGKILGSGNVTGFMTIHALLTKDNEIHVFQDAENMPKDIAIKACGIAIFSLFEQEGTIQ